VNFIKYHGQARLILEFFEDKLSENKLQLIGICIPLILLSMHSSPHPEDRRPLRSPQANNIPSWHTPMRPVPTHVPWRATFPHPWPTHAHVTAGVSYDTKYDSRPPAAGPVTLAAL
jgi:hypothetical protein